MVQGFISYQRRNLAEKDIGFPEVAVQFRVEEVDENKTRVSCL